MNRLKEKFTRFMYGRYGMDELGKTLLYVLLGLIVISMFFGGTLLNLLVWFLLIYTYYRMLSKNHTKRYAENQKFLQLKYKVKAQMNSLRSRITDKEHRIFKCPNCGQNVRVPRGKGQISIHCPKCHNDFVKRS